MRGFRDDFEAWHTSLTPEEKARTLRRALNERGEKYWTSDGFKQDSSKEKIQSFSKTLGRFFEAGADDNQEDVAMWTPDCDGLAKRAADMKMDFSLRNKIVEVNRDTSRRYQFATMKISEAERNGELPPQRSPLVEKWVLQNNDVASHKKNLELLEFIEKAKDDPSCPPDAKPYMEEWVKQGIPAMGENIELQVPLVLVNQLHAMSKSVVGGGLEEQGADRSEAEVEVYRRTKEKVPEMAARTIRHLTDKPAVACDGAAEEEVRRKWAFFRSQKEARGKTKADVLKEVWGELPKHTTKPLPPLDEEMLAELAEVPANIEGALNHSWGTTDVLYKSEAIDAFGLRYLLGVFETKAAAQKAFAEWNEEYEKARAEMKTEMELWGK